jgi:hypothetical protein
MLHHALMRGLEGGEGWRRGENYWRRCAVEMRRRRGGRLEEGECPDAWDRAVSERKERGRRSGPPGVFWPEEGTGRRD